jgi:hypothetical protein
VSFPVIRPEDVAHMPRRQIDRLLARLEEECHAAGIRHREILRARRMAQLRATRRDPERDAKPRRSVHGADWDAAGEANRRRRRERMRRVRAAARAA